MAAAPRTIQAIYDTRDGVVHVPDMHTYRDPIGIENIDEFVAWLNTKAKSARFTAITATDLLTTTRTGMGRQYAEYLKGEPEARIRAALKRRLSIDRIALVHRGGRWEVPDATVAIRQIAHEAKVTFNEARSALLTFLRTELGDIVDRAVFPPEDAVRPDDAATDEFGRTAYPVDL